jgi:predicted phosphodiesterase
MINNLMVVGDLHGNYEVFERIILKHNPYTGPIIFLGDLIEGDPKTDKSLKIIDFLKKHNARIIVLKGNHEASHIENTNLYRNNQPVSQLFRNQIRKKYKGKLEPYYTKYKNYFKILNDYYIYCNIFFSHAGPPNKVQKKLPEYFHWNRPMEDYNKDDVDIFLKKYSLDYMIVGHGHPYSYTWYGNQFILNSENGYYLDIPFDEPATAEIIEKSVKKV